MEEAGVEGSDEKARGRVLSDVRRRGGGEVEVDHDVHDDAAEGGDAADQGSDGGDRRPAASHQRGEGCERDAHRADREQ